MSMDRRAPYCKTDVWEGNDGASGYSLFICDTDKITETVFPYTITSGLELPSGSPSLWETSSSTLDSPDPSDSSGFQETPCHSSPPVGTIVGAVLGSVGKTPGCATGSCSR